jgi:formate/nitrite transporter
MSEQPRRILVVDDEDTVRRGIERVLAAQGAHVDGAADGAEALDLTRAQDYDVMLIDLRMPKVGGLEALARIRHENPDLATVVMTAYPSSDTAVEAMRLGATDYISKPLAPEQLISAVEHAVRKQHQIAAERARAAAAPSPEPAADLAPAAVADAVATRVSTAKATLPWVNLAILGMLAGVYIGFGAALATLVTSDAGQYVGFGISKLLGGLVFSVGLILVVIAGAELFTGNNLMVTGVLGGQIGVSGMIMRWIGVYATNFLGSVLLAGIMYGSALWMANNAGVGVTAIKIAHAKCSLPLAAAFFRGIGCNWLVCLAVWMSLSARETAGKILAIVFPITAFVALGYEHCVANMYFIPMGLFLKHTAAGAAAAATGLDLASLTWGSFLLDNLLPVTLGNIVGGGLFVGVVYWAAYLRKAIRKEQAAVSGE